MKITQGRSGSLLVQAHIAQRCEAAGGCGRSHKRATEKDRDWQREKQRLIRNAA